MMVVMCGGGDSEGVVVWVVSLLFPLCGGDEVVVVALCGGTWGCNGEVGIGCRGLFWTRI